MTVEQIAEYIQQKRADHLRIGASCRERGHNTQADYNKACADACADVLVYIRAPRGQIVPMTTAPDGVNIKTTGWFDGRPASSDKAKP